MSAESRRRDTLVWAVPLLVVVLCIVIGAGIWWITRLSQRIEDSDRELATRIGRLEGQLRAAEGGVPPLLSNLLPLVKSMRDAPETPALASPRSPQAAKLPKFRSLAVLSFAANAYEQPDEAELRSEAANLQRAFMALLDRSKLRIVPADQVQALLQGKPVRGPGGSLGRADHADALDPADIARKLSADAALTGCLTNIRRLDESTSVKTILRLRVQLVEAGTGLSAWAEEFPLEPGTEYDLLGLRKHLNVNWKQELSGACRRVAEALAMFALNDGAEQPERKTK